MEANGFGPCSDDCATQVGVEKKQKKTLHPALARVNKPPPLSAPSDQSNILKIDAACEQITSLRGKWDYLAIKTVRIAGHRHPESLCCTDKS